MVLPCYLPCHLFMVVRYFRLTAVIHRRPPKRLQLGSELDAPPGNARIVVDGLNAGVIDCVSGHRCGCVSYLLAECGNQLFGQCQF